MVATHQIINLLRDQTIYNLSEMFYTENYPWKILILDKMGTNIISQLFSIGHLRKLGVSLTLDLFNKRTAVSNSAVIYFIDACKDNIDQLIYDITNELYSVYFIDFTNTSTDDQLNYLINKLSKVKAKFEIKRLYDRCIRYVPYKKNVFTLKIPNALVPLYIDYTNEKEISQIINQCADGLLSLCINLNIIPVIKYPAKVYTASKMLGDLLNERLKEYIMLTKSSEIIEFKQKLPTEAVNMPILILFDRANDFIPLFAHHWCYDQLLDDLLNKNDNFIEHNDLKYDLSDLSDTFFAEHQYLSFSDVATSCSEKLKTFSAKMDKLHGINSTQIKTQSQLQNTLNYTINDATVIIKDKSLLDKHTTLCEALLKIINKRSIDKLSVYCSNLMSMEFTGSDVKANHIKQLKEFQEICDETDFLRCCIVTELSYGTSCYTCLDEIYKSKFKQIPKSVLSIRQAVDEFNKIKVAYNFNDVQNLQTQSSSTEIGNNLLGVVMGKGKGLFRQLVGNTTECKLIDYIAKALQYDESFSSISPIEIKEKTNDIVLFVLGGITSFEISAVEKWAKKNNLNITYGSTNIDTAVNIINYLTV